MNDHQVLDLVRRFRGTGHIVRFIEFMDVGNRNGWRRELVVPSRELLARSRRSSPLEPVEPGYRGEVASRYRFTDGQGEIGFISSVSQPFCRDCTRLRLSADGRLYTCLFAARRLRPAGAPSRAAPRTRSSSEQIRLLWRRRTDRYSEERDPRSDGIPLPKVEMYTSEADPWLTASLCTSCISLPFTTPPAGEEDLGKRRCHGGGPLRRSGGAVPLPVRPIGPGGRAE